MPDLLADLSWLWAAHCLADFPLQGAYLAETKGTNPHSLMAHATIWAGCICATARACGYRVDLADALLLAGVHALLDLAKARRWGLYRRLGALAALTLDQACHASQLVAFVGSRGYLIAGRGREGAEHG